MHVSIIAATLVFIISTAAGATAQRTFVSSTGNNANTCTLLQPCRDFASAATQTNVGGEIVVLDSAGYGPVTITKSLSIVAPGGVHAGISVAAGNGITINGAGVNVRLRGLQITGQGGVTGISFQQGTTLRVEDCSISGMSGDGVDVLAPNSTTFIEGTRIADGAAGAGVYADAAAGKLNVSISGSHLSGYPWGLYARQGAKVSVSSTVIAHNTLAGVVSNVDSAAASFRTAVTIIGSEISHNGIGVQVITSTGSGIASAHVTRSMLSENGKGFDANATAGVAHVTLLSSMVFTSASGSTTGVMGGFSQLYIADTRAPEFQTVTCSVTHTGFVWSAGNNNTGFIGCSVQAWPQQ